MGALDEGRTAAALRCTSRELRELLPPHEGLEPRTGCLVLPRHYRAALRELAEGARARELWCLRCAPGDDDVDFLATELAGLRPPEPRRFGVAASWRRRELVYLELSLV